MAALFTLEGRTAIVTGGASGMGFGIATAYCEAGANVVIADINEQVAADAAKTLCDQGYKAIGVQADVTDPENFKKALLAGEKEFGVVDILCNNAGITRNDGVFDITSENWDKIFALNTKAVFLCSQVFARRLVELKHGGNIVIIASNAAKVTFNGQAHYNASKAAAMNIAQSLSKELWSYGINVNAVCPGGTDTAMLKACMEEAIKADPSLTIEQLRVAWGAPCLGRLIQPVEVGRVVAFLSSDAATIIRGQGITVDAGSTPY